MYLGQASRLDRGTAAAEADLVAVHVAIDRLADTVRIHLVLCGFEPAEAVLRIERAQVVDEIVMVDPPGALRSSTMNK